MILENDYLLIALSLVALLLFWLGSRHNSFTTQVVAIGIQGPMAMWLLSLLQISQSDSLVPFINLRSFASAVAIATLLTSGYLVKSQISKPQIVVQAIATLIFGLVKKSDLYRWLGTALLVLVIGKLFFVDLVQLEMIWRVILFMGFGGLFLFVSYFVQSLARKNKVISK